MSEHNFERALHGVGPADMVSGSQSMSGQPMVGNDPTQGTGTSAWQQALRMGLQINARQRRN